MTSNFDDVPLPKGVGAEGGPATFEELLLRSLAKEGGSQSGVSVGKPDLCRVQLRPSTLPFQNQRNVPVYQLK